jgi:hypothetical protein
MRPSKRRAASSKRFASRPTAHTHSIDSLRLLSCRVVSCCVLSLSSRVRSSMMALGKISMIMFVDDAATGRADAARATRRARGDIGRLLHRPQARQVSPPSCLLSAATHGFLTAPGRQLSVAARLSAAAVPLVAPSRRHAQFAALQRYLGFCSIYVGIRLNWRFILIVLFDTGTATLCYDLCICLVKFWCVCVSSMSVDDTCLACCLCAVRASITAFARRRQRCSICCATQHRFTGLVVSFRNRAQTVFLPFCVVDCEPINARVVML